jgi:YcxB-like protein
VKLIYSLTLADFQAAQQLHWRQTLSRRLIAFAVYWCLPALCCSLGLLAGRAIGLFLTGLSAENVLLFGFVLGLLILGLWAPMSRQQRFRKKFERKYPPDRRSASIVIDDGGVSSAILGTDEVKFHWSSIVGCAQDDKMILFYMAKNRFVSLPTHGMTSAQRAEISDLVARHVVRTER